MKFSCQGEYVATPPQPNLGGWPATEPAWCGKEGAKKSAEGKQKHTKEKSAAPLQGPPTGIEKYNTSTSGRTTHPLQRIKRIGWSKGPPTHKGLWCWIWAPWVPLG